jgi:hypothetical protein
VNFSRSGSLDCVHWGFVGIGQGFGWGSCFDMFLGGCDLVSYAIVILLLA